MSSTSSSEKTSSSQHQTTRVADSTYGSDDELLAQRKELRVQETIVKFKGLKIQEPVRPYFAPPPTASSTPAEVARAWSAEHCGYWSPSWDDSVHPYARPVPYTIPYGTTSPAQRPPTAST